jgi:hypothetical protein
MPQQPHFDRDPGRVFRRVDPFATILEGIAATRVDDAALSRSRTRWLVRQAEEEGTLAGVLIDLAERGEPVVVTTTAGRRHRGTVRAMGADFVALALSSGTTVLVALDAVAAVRTRPGVTSVAGDRSVRLERNLAEVLTELAAERTGVVIGAAGAEVRGELRAVGRDIATLRVDGPPAIAAYVQLAAASDVLVSR